MEPKATDNFIKIPLVTSRTDGARAAGLKQVVAVQDSTASAATRKTGKKRRNACHAIESPSVDKKKGRTLPLLSGLWTLLPQELVDLILDRCSAKQLAMLETTCSFFKRTNMVENVAELRLKTIPRAKGMIPNPQ